MSEVGGVVMQRAMIVVETAIGQTIRQTIALWSGINKNRDVSTGPLARPFARSLARSLAPLTRSLAPDCSLRSRPPPALTRSLARSLPRSWDSEFLMSQNDLVLSHSELRVD